MGGAFEGELRMADSDLCNSHAHRRSTRGVEDGADAETEAVRAVDVPYGAVMAAQNERILKVGLCVRAIAASRLRRRSVWGYCAPSEAVHCARCRDDGAAAAFWVPTTKWFWA